MSISAPKEQTQIWECSASIDSLTDLSFGVEKSSKLRNRFPSHETINQLEGGFDRKHLSCISLCLQVCEGQLSWSIYRSRPQLRYLVIHNLAVSLFFNLFVFAGRIREEEGKVNMWNAEWYHILLPHEHSSQIPMEFSILRIYILCGSVGITRADSQIWWLLLTSERCSNFPPTFLPLNLPPWVQVATWLQYLSRWSPRSCAFSLRSLHLRRGFYSSQTQHPFTNSPSK